MFDISYVPYRRKLDVFLRTDVASHLLPLRESHPLPSHLRRTYGFRGLIPFSTYVAVRFYDATSWLRCQYRNGDTN